MFFFVTFEAEPDERNKRENRENGYEIILKKRPYQKVVILGEDDNRRHKTVDDKAGNYPVFKSERFFEADRRKHQRQAATEQAGKNYRANGDIIDSADI